MFIKTLQYESLALPSISTKMKKMPTYTQTGLECLRHDNVMHSRLDIDELLCQAMQVDVGQTAHAVFCHMRSLSERTDSLPLCSSLSGLLFREGDDVSPTFHIYVYFFLGI
jgi:hypothetical protein